MLSPGSEGHMIMVAFIRKLLWCSYDAATASMSFNVTMIGEQTEETGRKDVSAFSLPTLPAVIIGQNRTVLENVALFIGEYNTDLLLSQCELLADPMQLDFISEAVNFASSICC